MAKQSKPKPKPKAKRKPAAKAVRVLSQSERTAQRDRMRAKRKAERDIEIPPCLNPKRRARCERDLLKFGHDYFPHIFAMPLADAHVEIAQDFERTILHGGQNARAAPRGFGKDTWLMVGIIWSLCYGHLGYVAYGGPEQGEADQKLQNIKQELETNPQLLEDFPEVCVPIRALERAAQRAKTQTHNGEHTYIEWGVSKVVFATIKRDGKPTVSSGAVVESFGLTAGARGMNHNGRRPDGVVVNDAENEKIANSEAEKSRLRKTLDKDLAGLAGPGVRLRMFMLCTIIAVDSIADEFTDRQRRPSWNGKRYKTLITEPERMDLWQEYIEKRRDGQRENDPEGREAHEFYRKNRKAMDAGAEVIWKENYVRANLSDGKPAELSALQHIFNQWADYGDDYFWCELQNDPQPPEDLANELTAAVVASRVNHYPERIVPEGVTKIVEGIDVGQRELHCVAKGFWPDGTSCVLEYVRFEVLGLPDTDSAHAKRALEQRVLEALRMRRDELASVPFETVNGEHMHCHLHLVDSGYFTDTIYAFCAESGNRYRPIKGLGSSKGLQRYSNPAKGAKNTAVGFHWYKRFQDAARTWLWHLDVDFWKQFTQLRYLQVPGTPGSSTLWGADPKMHRMYAQHIVSERLNVETNKMERVSRHNHYLDAEGYCNCGGAMLGIRLMSNTERVTQSEQRTTATAAPVPANQGERHIRKKVAAW